MFAPSLVYSHTSHLKYVATLNMFFVGLSHNKIDRQTHYRQSPILKILKT